MLVGDPELFQGSELRTHILARGGASGVPDEDFDRTQGRLWRLGWLTGRDDDGLSACRYG